MRPTIVDAGSLVAANDNKRFRLVANAGTTTEENTK